MRGGHRFETMTAAVALFVAYVLTGRLGLGLAETQENVTLMWAPTGIAIGGLVAFSVRLWPVVFAGALAVNIGSALPLAATALIACGNTLEALTAWYLLVRVARIDVRLARLRDVGVFLLFGVALSTMVSASIGTAALWTTGAIAPSAAGGVWLDWWLGDAGGALVIAPLIMVGARGEPPWSSLLRRPETYLVMALLALCLGIALSNHVDHSWQRVLLVFAAFPFVVWAGLRLGPRGAILASVISASVGVGSTALGGRLLDGTNVHENLLTLWAFVAALGATAMILAAAVAERNAADAARAESDAERTRLEEAMLRKKHLESLGVLAGGVAHDFNNLLAIVSLNMDAVRLEMGEPSPGVVELLRDADHATARAAALCDQLLTYAGKRTPALASLDVAALCRELTQMLRASIAKRVEIEVQTSEDKLWVLGDSSQLTQLVMNLVINGSEASEPQKNGRVTVRAREATGDLPSPRPHHPALDPAAGPFVVIEVEDDGAGMSDEVIEHLFDPFFTTKFTGRGLGMASVLGVVASHRGQIDIRSQVGRGTTISVYLPRTKGTAPALNPATPPTDVARPLRVLLADDEEAVREVVERVLAIHGHAVEAYADGRDALAAFAESPERFDLLILDATMPEMGGLEALAAIRKTAPAIPAVLMSGYSEDDLADLGSTAAYLKKPFRISELENALLTALRLQESRLSDETGGVAEN